MFFVLVFWLLATLWSNALEPSKTELLPGSVAAESGEASSSTFKSLDNPSLVTASGVALAIWSWVGIFAKALTFDYAWFDGWTIGTILRIICIIFSVASLWYLADLIWKIRSMLLGQ